MLKCLPGYAGGLPGIVARPRAWLDAWLHACPSWCSSPSGQSCSIPAASLRSPSCCSAAATPCHLPGPGHLRGRWRAGGCLRTRLFLPPPRSCPLPRDALYPTGWRHRDTQVWGFLSPGGNRCYLDPDPGPKSTGDAVWDLLWLLYPHLVPTSLYPGRERCCPQALGEQWERAEHPHGVVVKGLGRGRGLTTFNHNSLSPHVFPAHSSSRRARPTWLGW